MSDAEKRVEKQDAVLAEFTRGLFLWEGGGERQRRMADEIVRLRAENAALTAAVERVQAACENDLRWVDAQPILRALEETP